MKKLLLTIVALLVLSVPCAAQSSKATLTTETATNFPDNTTGAITPSILRTTMGDYINSWQQAPQVNAQTGTTYTFLVGDYGKLVTFSNASPVAVTLPQATGSFATWNVFTCNKGAGAVTITPTTSTIGGSATKVLQQNQCTSIVSDGTNYQIASGTIQPVTCAASNWINVISSGGVPACSQPAFTDISGTLQVNKGGTGITSGTSGGVPYFSGATAIASSGALTANGVVYGGGAGVAPAATSAGANGQVFLGQTSAAPAFATMSGDASITAAGVLTNAKVNGVAYPSSPSTNTVPVVTSANTITYEAVPNAALANSSISVAAGSNVALSISGSPVSLGGTVTIGSTSDTPRFAGLGLNCAASGAGLLTLCGSSSGFVNLKAPAIAGSNTVTFPAGTTDFSGTGGTSQVVKQTSAGGAFTVAQLGFSDLSGSLSSSQFVSTTITGQTVNNSPNASNDYLIYYSAGDNAVRRCTVGACAAAATAGVSSLNGLTGSLSIVQGTGIGVSAGGSSVTVALSSARQTLPTRQVLTSGSSATYTTPANTLWIEVEMCGGGGGGAGGGASPGAAGAGNNTTFSTFTANGGSAGSAAGPGAAGGAASGGQINIAGGGGNAGTISVSGTAASVGGIGGNSFFGGAGYGAYNAAGSAAGTNSCSGGGGGAASSAATNLAGSGGGAGGYVRSIINGPSATYTYTVGSGGAGGSAGTNGYAGGNGAAGIIIVTEHYGT